MIPPRFGSQPTLLGFPFRRFFSRLGVPATCLALCAAAPTHAAVFDANDLTISASSGDGVLNSSNAGANGGNMRIYMANAVSDFITLDATLATTGTYDVAVRYHKNPNRGTVQLAIDGVDQSGAQDLYDAVGVFDELSLGSVSLSAGTVSFRFTSTGHNASSSSYRVAIDTITLTPVASRTDITTFATITDALDSGVPLYAPPGTYTLPVGYALTADIDILGDLDPALRPVFEVQNPSFTPGDYSIRLQGIAFVGSAGGKKLLSITTETFDIPEFIVLDCSFDSCNPINWATFPAITGQVIQRMEMRRFSIADANRGLYAAGRVDDYDITDFTIDDCGRFGICIGPAGTGINETITSFMQRGLVARGVITGTLINTGYNHAQLALSGHNVVVEDMDLHNMVLPAVYYTDPAKATDYPHDSEPFYTKVENLTVNNLYIENDGAYQAMWADKGTSEYTKSPVSPEGRDSIADNLTFVNTGSRYCVGIWHQTSGDCVYKNVTMHNRTRDAVIIQADSATGSLTIENWVDVNPPNATSFPGVKNKSLNNDTTATPPAPDPVDVTIINSPTLTEFAP